MIEIKQEERDRKIVVEQALMFLFVLAVTVFMKFITSMARENKQLIIKIFQDISLKEINA